MTASRTNNSNVIIHHSSVPGTGSSRGSCRCKSPPSGTSCQQCTCLWLPLREGGPLMRAPAAPRLLAGAPADLACASAPWALSASLNYVLARVWLLGNLGISTHDCRLPSSDKSQGRGQALPVPTGPACFRTSRWATRTAHVSLSCLSGCHGRRCHLSCWWPTWNPPLRNSSYFIGIILNRHFIQ